MKSGFTLLELLVALAIFSILSAMAFSGLSRSLSITSRLIEEALFSRSLASAWARMGSDVAQCQDAPKSQDDEPTADHVLLLWPAPSGVGTSNARRERLKKIEYRQGEGALVRLAWFAVPGGAWRMSRANVLSGVEGFSVHSTLEEGARRPRTVAVTLNLRGRGSWTRILECAR